jgi:hypothetical protein
MPVLKSFSLQNKPTPTLTLDDDQQADEGSESATASWLICEAAVTHETIDEHSEPAHVHVHVA